jgi:hypothetical protein
MNVNQKILELLGLVHAIRRLEESLDDQEELFEISIQKRDQILMELSVEQINDSTFLTPQEREYLFQIKSKI